MSRPGAVTFKGNPLTLAGEEVSAGQTAPDFTLHFFDPDTGMNAITLEDMKGKPTILSVVPSLDTPVCQTQTKKFNEEIGDLGDKINALNITNIRPASDYQDRTFGQNWGMLIEELKILARGTFVLDASGNVVYAETVKEVTDEPDYKASLDALRKLTS